jgi:hypothetical protein
VRRVPDDAPEAKMPLAQLRLCDIRSIVREEMEHEYGYFKELRVAADGNEKWFWQFGEPGPDDVLCEGTTSFLLGRDRPSLWRRIRRPTLGAGQRRLRR